MPIIFSGEAAWLFWGTTILWLALEIWLTQRDREKLRDSRDQGSRHVIIALAFIGIIAALVVAAYVPQFALSSSSSSSWLLLITGTSVMWAGLLLRIWAIRTLGKFFIVEVTVQPNQTVVKHGPYRLLRHPSYTGNLLILLGMGIAMGNSLSILFCLLGFSGFLYRIFVEEHFLASALGEPYKEYMSETWRLIPGVW